MSYCYCGAEDCIRCYPGNFDGRTCLVALTCIDCFRDWSATTADEAEAGVCEDCREKEKEGSE